MPRLGELLVAAGVITDAQLEQGLRAQIVHGARLGTNLVELGVAELDQIADGLARQHEMPPAKRRHFERVDPEVTARLPAALAAKLHVVPVGYLANDVAHVMVACRDPLTAHARGELEAAMGLAPGGAVLAICGELRLLYFLERVYGIARANRFLRVRRATTLGSPWLPSATPWETATEEELGPPPPEASQYRAFEDTTGRFPPAPEVGDDDETRELRPAPFDPPDDFHIEETPIEHILDAAPRRPRFDPDRTPAPPPPVEVAPTTAAPPAGGEELRRFVETIADAPSAAPVLGRVALRKARVSASSGSSEIAEAADLARVFATCRTIEDYARAIRRASTRNRVGELAIGGLQRLGAGLEAAALFVLREDVAIGWKGFVAGADDVAVDELAVPLDAPTVLSAAARDGRALLIDGGHGTEIDRRLWAALGKPSPGEVACAPVILADHPVCLVYGQAPRMAPYAELFAAVTQAVTTAFARMLRAAQR